MSLSPDEYLDDVLGRVNHNTWASSPQHKVQLKEVVMQNYQSHRLHQTPQARQRRFMIILVAILAASGSAVAGVLAIRATLKVTATGPGVNAQILTPEGETATLTITDGDGQQSSVTVDTQGSVTTTGAFDDSKTTIERTEVSENE